MAGGQQQQQQHSTDIDQVQGVINSLHQLMKTATPGTPSWWCCAHHHALVPSWGEPLRWILAGRQGWARWPRCRKRIMVDKHPLRFRFFTIFSWTCFWTSVVLMLNGASLGSRFFRGTFVFCIANSVFIFQISQIVAYLPSAFICWGLIMLWGIRVIRIAGWISALGSGFTYGSK